MDAGHERMTGRAMAFGLNRRNLHKWLRCSLKDTCLDLYNKFGHLHLTGGEGAVECPDDNRIELAPGTFHDDFFGFEWRRGFAVRTVAGERIVSISDGNDARLQWDVLSSSRMVSRTIEVVVVRKDDGKDSMERAADGVQDFSSFFNVRLNLLGFFAGQARGLIKKIAADIELADVMEECRGADVFDALLVESKC
jgi:hypothetical protein